MDGSDDLVATEVRFAVILQGVSNLAEIAKPGQIAAIELDMLWLG